MVKQVIDWIKREGWTDFDRDAVYVWLGITAALVMLASFIGAGVGLPDPAAPAHPIPASTQH